MSINSRDQFLLKGRPEIPSIQNTTKTLDLEVFQNKVLRPILKLQNTMANIISNYKFPSGIKLSVDVDPINFN